MKQCSLCGRDIPELATVCDQCERWTSESLALSIPDAIPVEALAQAADVAIPEYASTAPPATAPAATAPPAPAARMGGRGLLIALVAVVVVAGIAMALLMSRAAPSEVAAAQAPAPAPQRSAVAASQAASVPTMKWSGQNTSIWVGNRRNAAAFELPAENMVPVWMKQVRPMLIVRCMSNSTQAFVFTGSALKMEPETEDHTVTFSFDDEAEVTERWPDSAEHDALFAPDGAAFTERLVRARTLRFGYTPHNAMPATARFQVSGLGELIAPAARECGRKK